jgi:thiosulfate reductase cytochrome b subunit
MTTQINQRQNKTQVNWIWDAILIGAFALLMEPDFSGLTLHEWGGLVMGAALVIHVILHWKWVVNVTRRIFQSVNTQVRIKYWVDAGLAISFLTIILTGIAISTTLNTAAILGLSASLLDVARQVHFLSTDLTLVLVAVHMALSWKWIVNTTQRTLLGQPSLQPTAAPSERVGR